MLNGSLPSSFANLIQLKFLYLARNRLSGIIPDHVFPSMKSIAVLNLAFNYFSSSIPSSIGNLSSLNDLMLNNNYLSGEIPTSIGNLKNLKSMDLSSNHISGKIPYSIGQLLQMSLVDTTSYALSIAHNNVTGPIPDSLGNLSQLIYLDLSHNKLTGPIPSSISGLVSLYDINLSYNQLTGPLPRQLMNAKIHTLDLSNNPLGLVVIPNWLLRLDVYDLSLANTGIKHMSEWLNASIGHFDLSSNKLTWKLPLWLVHMESLRSLNLSNKRFYGSLETVFNKEGWGYESIDLSYNKFTGAIDKDIGVKPSMTYITSLILSNNRLGGSIPKSIGNLSHLQVLKLVSTRLEGEIPQELGEAEQLTTILLSKNRLAGSIPTKVLDLKYLQNLDVSRNQLSGKIPPHSSNIPASAFSRNHGLCGAPLPPCK